MLRRLVIVFFLFPFFLSSQGNDSIPLLRSFKFTYENDLFTHTDRYYTGGTFVEFNLPCLRKNPVSKILLKLSRGTDESFGIAISNLGFTPASIISDSILFGDRPFSSTLYIGFNRVSCNYEKQIRLTSNLDLGVIGPAAFGYENQKFIHAKTNNPEPHGWQFQIKNDVIVNYSLKLEKGLLQKKRIVELIGYGFVNAGTIYNNGGLGLLTRIGRTNHYFSLPGFSNRFQFWIFGKGEGKLIARDASLQGGIFNTKSIYIINPEDMNRSTFSVAGGIAFAYKSIRLELCDTYLSPEFRNCKSHAWGHIGLEIVF